MELIGLLQQQYSIDDSRIYALGYSMGGYHAWNVVLLDGEHYAMDVTWDDPVMQEEIFGPVLPVLTFEDFREINIEVSSSKGISNLVEVSFGKDISLDGILSTKEVGLVFKFADAYAMCSYSGTNVFLHESEQMITNAVMNLTFLSDGNIQSFNIALNGDTVAELPKPPLTKDIMSQWDIMRVVRRGSSISNEHIDIRIATDMTILLLK